VGGHPSKQKKIAAVAERAANAASDEDSVSTCLSLRTCTSAGAKQSTWKLARTRGIRLSN
jgi:hypothetical protein